MEINKRKSTASCSSNQQCHFNHKVIAHPVAETLLCDNSPVKIKELRAMIELNIRELRGLDISYRYTIKEENGIWLVPSSSGRGEKYKVCLKPESCTCPDFEIRRNKCKHIFAVEFVIKNAPLNDIISKDKAKLISDAPKITL